MPELEKCTKSTQNFPNGLKISQISLLKMFQMANLRPSKLYPNWDFWFENKPSGNPALEVPEQIFLRTGLRSRFLLVSFSAVLYKFPSKNNIYKYS
jgi:hypothetical protein